MPPESTVLYNTNLSKAQGLVPETMAVLSLWEPGMSSAELLERVKATGILGKATATRMRDIVIRGFAQRYLCNQGIPAQILKSLVSGQADRGLLHQILLIYTARHNPVFHDFVTSVYWRKVALGAQSLSRADSRDFVERAVASGKVQPPWTESLRIRVARYLLGTLEDFQMLHANRNGTRRINPPSMLPGTALFLSHDLHFQGIDTSQIPFHADWGLFGIKPGEVLQHLDAAAARGHFQFQNSGALLRIDWQMQTYKELADVLVQ
jgi:hypothetical protein